MSNEVDHNLMLMGETVKAKILYELAVGFKSSEFFKADFKSQQEQNEKICRVIFKLGNNELS